MAKELTEKEFVEGLKAAKLDIKTAADCLTDVMQYVAIQDPQSNTEESRNCLFWLALAREKLSDICNNLEQLEEERKAQNETDSATLNYQYGKQ